MRRIPEGEVIRARVPARPVGLRSAGVRILLFAAAVLCGGATAATAQEATAVHGQSRTRQASPIVIGYLAGPVPARTAVDAGVTLGEEEAAHTLGLLGRGMRLDRREARTTSEAVEAVRELAGRGATAVVTALPDAVQEYAAAAAARAGVLLLDARPRSAGAAACAQSHFALGLTDRIAQAAAAAADLQEADAMATVVWHPSLGRYGAEQLNERFRRRFERGMGGGEWTGWMAMKILTEAALRMDGSGASALRAYLLSERAAFDGHKGRPLTFRASDRQLIQPLYAVTPSGVEQLAWPGEESIRNACD